MTCGCKGKISYTPTKAKAKAKPKPKTAKATGKVPVQGVSVPKSTKPTVDLPQKISRGSEYGRVMYQI